MIDAARKTEMEMKKMKQEAEFAKHLGLVKEYRKVIQIRVLKRLSRAFT